MGSVSVLSMRAVREEMCRYSFVSEEKKYLKKQKKERKNEGEEQEVV